MNIREKIPFYKIQISEKCVIGLFSGVSVRLVVRKSRQSAGIRGRPGQGGEMGALGAPLPEPGSAKVGCGAKAVREGRAAAPASPWLDA